MNRFNKYTRAFVFSTASLIGSLSLMAHGQNIQEDCLDTTATELGFADASSLPERVINESGCVNWANTAGLLGTVASVGGVLSVPFALIRDSRREKEADESAPQRPFQN